MLFNNIIKLDRDINDLKKNNKKYLKDKKYRKLILALSNDEIISIVLSNVIPHCIKYENIVKQNLVSLYEKIGKDTVKIFYINE